MLILAVDTSLPLLSVALLRDDTLVGAIALEGKGSRNEKLLPAIDWLLAECAVDRREVDVFAVTRGPGSFTGVRIGLATIQGLALVLGRPVCAMSTHEAIALGEGGPHDERIMVWDDAGRGEFYLSVFAGVDEVVPARLTNAGEKPAYAERSTLVISVADFLQHANAAAGCARRARELALSGAIDRYKDVTPIYVRLAEADVKLQQQKSNG